MATRRTFLKSGMGAGAALALGAPGFHFARAQGTTDQAARNKAIVRRFKEAQRTPDYEQVLRETQSPDYRRLHGTHTRSLFGLPPTNEIVEMAEVGIMTFDGSRWATGWFFGDDLGMALQLGHPEIFG